MAGFAGCKGLGVATHVGMLWCKCKQAQYHNSPKLDMPSRTYDMLVNHSRKIQSTTSDHKGHWNNCSLIKYDDFHIEMKNGQRCLNM